MKRSEFSRQWLPVMAIGFSTLALPASVAAASPSPYDSVRFCVPFDYEQWRRDHPLPAAKRAADLNAGEPRTVRLIYFLPNDRPYRAKVVQEMKDRIREVQGFYSASMRARGHGDRTFRFETDAAGEPMVHRVPGRHADSHYLEDTFGKVLDEVEQTFDIERNVYLAVIDISTDVIDRLAGGIGIRNGKNGGFGLVTSDEMDPFNFHNVVSHELGHAFGLQHDFRDDRYVMSYGNWQESSLSPCNAGFLAVHPHFNAEISIDAGPSPTIDRTSPLTYPEAAKSVSIQLEVSDADGLHQVILFVRELQVKACREFTGETQTVVAFDYNGVIPVELAGGGYTSLADPPRHPIFIRAVDTAGNASEAEVILEAIRSESTLPRPHRLVKVSGDDQEGEPGSSLATPLIVEVRDQYDNPLPGAQVTFSVRAGDGRLSGRFSIENVTTDADGRAERTLTLGPNPGTNVVEVSSGELPDETFQAVGRGEPVAPPSITGSFRTWHLPDGATLRLGSGRIENNDRAVAFSPDGQRFAVARNNGIWLYDTETYGPITFLPAERQVASMSFSPDGTLLAWSQWFSYETPETVKVWDLAAGRLTAEIYYPELWAIAVAFSRDGTLLAIGGGLTNDVFLFDTETWRQVAEYPGIGASSSLDEPFSISFSPDGRLLASGSGSSDRAIGLWDVTTHTRVATLEGHTYPVASTSFSPDGSILASGSWDRTIKLWDVATHEAVATLEGHTDRVLSVTFSEDGTTLASASRDGAVKLWDVAGRENAASLQGPGVAVGSVTFSPDGLLASGYIDGSVRFWDVSARGVVRELGGSVATTSAAFSGDGRILAMGSDDKTIKIWDLETGTWAGSLEGHAYPVASVAFLEDGKTLVTGAYQEIKLWQAARQGSFSLMAEYFRRACQIYYIVPSPDGTKIASGGPYEIVLWDPETREQTATAASTTTLSFSPDGKQLVSKSFDGFIELWDAATLQKTEMIPIGHTSVDTKGGFVLFSPDGKLLATGTDYTSAGHIVGSVKLWDTVTKENVATFDEQIGQIRSGAFSPDGSLLAAGSFYGKIKLFDVENRKRVATLEGHAGSVESLSFSPDGAVLASGSSDGTVLLWDVAPYLAPPISNSDFDGDGSVGFGDFLLFARAFGLSRGDTGFEARYDLDGDGAVGFSDFLILAGSFGTVAS